MNLSMLVWIVILLVAFLTKQISLPQLNSKNASAVKKNKLFLAFSISYMFYSFGTDYLSAIEAQKNYEKCIGGNAHYCNKISYVRLVDEFGYKSKMLKLVTNKICAVEPSYCEKVVEPIQKFERTRNLSSEVE